MRNHHFPNCGAVTGAIVYGDIALQQQWKAYALACLQPSYNYFASHFLDGGLQETVRLFNSARLFSPGKVAKIQPTVAEVNDRLRQLEFLNNDACIHALQRELSTYIAAAEDINPDTDVISWWKNHGRQIPN